ncbi:alpha/beta hydrolase [Rhodococcoides kyotonense]|uniref:BAAT / Acyl-CoA thioester hydrolase C terminal n=1 Tax=Rhodococcoides kyotonense TaxID=398843 RepID=A0A239NC40_9NOCA|nr:acyl-CoA thioester hydrolase/BAAT C-terminal domain-containing protein [Rhodococcus kyotonensis]SNT51739.1 BAAT / Acyl-CoA thioester hydrolase C terminal [Rhodococcus kyotonensis]
MEPVSLQVDPVSGPIDSATVFRVHGVAPGLPVHLDIATIDADGHHWISQQDCDVDSNGQLRIADPDRPWWNMKFVDEGIAPVTFVGSEAGLDYRISVHAHEGSSSTTVRRSWGDDLVREDHVGNGWHLRIYLPDTGESVSAGVLLLPGTMGARPSTPTAALLASHGYVSAVLSYMGEPGLPNDFEDIPIEAIAAGMAAFASHERVDADRIAVHAASVGVSVALSALVHTPGFSVRAVVAVAPTHVVLQALADGAPPPKASSLTVAGEPLPYMPIRVERLLGQIAKRTFGRVFSPSPTSRALSLRPAYSAGLRDDDAVAQALIPVEKIDAPMLAIAGVADASYPADRMARALLARRRRDTDRLLILPNAGHFLRPPATPTTVDRNNRIVSGGTPAGTAKGQRRAWNETLDFLSKTLAAN